MVLTPHNLKYFLIFIMTFCIIYWFQIIDDKKICKEKTNIYDKIKLPLLASAIVGLVILWINDSLTTISVCSISNETSIFERPIKILNNHHNLDIYTELPEW